jgi:hypothetical protein
MVVCYDNLEIVITKCSYDWWRSNKSIHPIQNPLLISDVTHVRYIILENEVGSF